MRGEGEERNKNYNLSRGVSSVATLVNKVAGRIVFVGDRACRRLFAPGTQAERQADSWCLSAVVCACGKRLCVCLYYIVDANITEVSRVRSLLTYPSCARA